MLHDMQSSIKPRSWFGVFLHCCRPGTTCKCSTHSIVVCIRCGIMLACAVRKWKTRLTERKALIPRSLFTCHLAKVMSDLCQEGLDNDVTTGSRKSAGISGPSGILWTNQIHNNGNIDIRGKIMALARLAT